MNVWCVRAHAGEYAEHFRKGGYVGLHYSIDEPYPVGKDREAFAEIYRKHHPDVTSNIAVRQRAGQLQKFCEMKAGDYVITPSAKAGELFYGVVEGEGEDAYYFVAEPEDDCPHQHRRPVKWNEEPVFRGTLSVPLQNTLNCWLTVFAVSSVAEFLTAIDEEIPSAVSDVAEGSESPQPVIDPHQIVLGKILELDASEFEILIGCLLEAIGFGSTEVRGRTGDGGVDVVGTLDLSNIAKVDIYVQVKRYKQGRISKNVVRDLRGRIPHRGQGAVITTSEFQKAAYEVASDENFPHVGLINGRQLVQLLVEHWEKMKIPEEFQDKLGLEIEKRLVPKP